MSDERLGRIETKLDAIQADVSEIKVLDAIQNGQLAEHMRRTDTLEKRLDSIWSKALLALSLVSGAVALIKSILT